MRYSIFALAAQALRGNRGWAPAWRDAGAEAELRRRHRRRRRAWAGDRLLPGQGARHHQCRGAGEGLYRLRQCRAQHHHRPLQLPAARQHAVLRALAEALGGAGAGPQLQRHGQPARRAQPLPLRRAARRLCPARQRHAAARRRCRAARPRRRCGRCCRSSISTTRASRSRAGCCSGAAARRATTPSPGAMRAPPTGAASTSSRTARSPASGVEGGRVTGVETTRGDIGAGKVGAGGRRQHLARRRDGRPAPADREPCAAGLRLRRR